MTIPWGKIHKYLGMNIDYSSIGKLTFSLIEYIVNMFDDIPEDMKGESATPVLHHLFDIVEYQTKLSRKNFHHFVAQLLYLKKISHLDI